MNQDTKKGREAAQKEGLASQSKAVRFLTRQAIVAALYAVLTWALPMLAYGPLQFRISEVLTLLAFYNPTYIVGLVVGCAIANIPSSLGPLDLFVGTLASFLALFTMRRCKNIWVASLMPAIFNILIAVEIWWLSETALNFFLVAAQIAFSEFIIVTVFGVPLFKGLSSNEHFKKLVLADHSHK